MFLLGTHLNNRLFLGTGRYPSSEILEATLRAARPGMVTAAIRRIGSTETDGRNFAEMLRELQVPVLPNTAGCHQPGEAVATARLARDMFETNWIKLEVIGSAEWLEPDVVGLVEAATILVKEGFEVFPYTTDDLRVAERLLRAGCQVLMPWAAPIGSGFGLENRAGLLRLRRAFPHVPMIVDAGLGLPSQAADVLEAGFDAVLLNSAVARSGDPVRMALAFSAATYAGRLAFEAGPMSPQRKAQCSTPDVGKAAIG